MRCPSQVLTLTGLLALAHGEQLAGFVGPFGPRVQGGLRPSPSEAPSVGHGLTEEEVRTLLRGRYAVVVAGNDDRLGLAVTEGLAEVGAQVVFGCLHPERVQAACTCISQRCEATATTEATAGSGSTVPVGSAEARYIDLADPGSVWSFADALLAEERPLHVYVDCADDVSPSYQVHGEGGWESTVGTTHLGPFLLGQLLLDRMMDTMRRDAAAFAARRDERRAARRRSRRERIAAVRKLREEGPTSELKARPHPSPLGRIVSLGVAPQLTRRRPTPVAGLYLSRGNYSAWGARRAALEANTLSYLQLARLLAAAALPSGECVEVNVVAPSRARWLPRRVRALFGTHHDPSISACFLASSPVMGMSGLFFDQFASQPPWQKTARGIRPGKAQSETFLASLRRSGAPSVEWQSEAMLSARGYQARQRRRPAVVR